MKKFFFATTVVGLVVLLSACSGEEAVEPEEDKSTEQIEQQQSEQNDHEDNSATEIKLSEHSFYKSATDRIVEHIHGVGYAGNSNAVFFASHEGLVAYQDGAWYETKDQKHDYMGFQAIDSGFYASGHPAHGTNLKNPLGLIKSENEGESFEKLAFYGETDFHHMTVGYYNHMIYVVNQHPNSKLENGVYYSSDDGESWKQSKIKGFPDKPVALYAHPSEESKVAIAAADGVYQSEDYGDSFEKITESMSVTALSFARDGSFVAASFNDDKAVLSLYTEEGSKQEDLPLPALANDVIYYVAVNPERPNEIVFSTNENNGYITTNQGEDWTQMINQGKLVSGD